MGCSPFMVPKPSPKEPPQKTSTFPRIVMKIPWFYGMFGSSKRVSSPTPKTHDIPVTYIIAEAERVPSETCVTPEGEAKKSHTTHLHGDETVFFYRSMNGGFFMEKFVGKLNITHTWMVREWIFFSQQNRGTRSALAQVINGVAWGHYNLAENEWVTGVISPYLFKGCKL